MESLAADDTLHSSVSFLSSPSNVVPSAVLDSICNLSVLVITYPGKWTEPQFLPSPVSRKKIEWFEGTGTVIKVKRNRVFILSSIHCIPRGNYSFFVKGEVTGQVQVLATLCVNYFVADNNGIDFAVFSCDACHFRPEVLLQLSNLTWKSPDSFVAGSQVWLVHYPTLVGSTLASTSRLENPVFPTVSDGTIVSDDLDTYTIDSTIIATGGSSGGIVINNVGFAVGIHDSQHNDNTPMGVFVSTHRLVCALKEKFDQVRQLHGIFGDT